MSSVATMGGRGPDRTPRRKQYVASSPPVGYVCVQKLVQSAIRTALAKHSVREARRRYVNAFPEKAKATVAKCRKACYEKNKTAYLATNKAWEKANAERTRTIWRKMQARKRSTPHGVVVNRLRNRLSAALRRGKANKAGKTLSMIGCSSADLAGRIEALVPDGHNLGDCHIDHIFPFACYDLNDSAQQARVMHWSNLQVLLPVDNLRKKNALPTKSMAAQVEAWAWPDGVAMEDLPDAY